MDNVITITQSEFTEVAKVHNLISEFAGSEVDFAGRIQGKTHLIIVAHHNNALAGYSISYDRFNDGSLYCWMGGVVDNKRRLGVYQAMADYREKYAKENGFTKLCLKTRNSRRGMMCWLVKQGWLCVAVEQQVDPKENSIIFEKELSPLPENF